MRRQPPFRHLACGTVLALVLLPNKTKHLGSCLHSIATGVLCVFSCPGWPGTSGPLVTAVLLFTSRLIRFGWIYHPCLSIKVLLWTTLQ